MAEEPTPPPPIIPGVARALSPLVRRIAASGENGDPGPNTYLVGIDEIAVIDPGPDDADHIASVVGCGGDRIVWLIVLHPTRADAIANLKDRTGAEVVAAPGVDVEADIVLAEGKTLLGTEFRLTAIEPSDDSGRLCLVLDEERLLFAGNWLDVESPERAATVAKFGRYRLKSIAPAEGQVIDNPKGAFESAP